MKFDLMSATYQIQDQIPIVYLFARDENRNRKIIRDKNFRPYIFVPAEDGDLVDAKGRKVKKLIYDLPTRTRQIRSQYSFTCESDIRFVYRYLIDKGIYCGFEIDNGQIKPCETLHIPMRILYFDIEILCPTDKLPRPEDPIYPICCISACDSYTGEIKVFTYGITPVENYQENFDSEFELLTTFTNWIREKDFDVLAGWNCNMFDFPYLINRCKKIKFPIERISPLGFVAMREKPKISGREVVDMMIFYQSLCHATQQEHDSWDLKSILQKVCNFYYTDYGDSIELLFNNPAKHKELVNYCWNDVYALKLFDEQVGLISLYDTLRRIAGCMISEANRPSVLIDMLALRLREHPLPAKPEVFENHKTKYKGALVRKPPVGIQENIAVLDFARLYAFIIMAFKLSPDIEKVLVKVTQLIVNKREELRKKRILEGKQNAIDFNYERAYKMIYCSIYGYTGYEGSRLYEKENAEQITSWGVKLSLFVADEVMKEFGYKTIYGDTDSLFIQVPSVEEARKVEKFINTVLVNWSKQQGLEISPEVKLEKFFRKVFFKLRTDEDDPAKKMYAGHVIWENGKEVNKLVIAGMAPRRSDTAVATKEAMTKFFEEVLLRDNISAGIKCIKQLWDELPSMPLWKVGIPRGLNQSEYKTKNPWLEGAQYSAEKFGLKFREDRKPRLIYVKNAPVSAICVTEETEKLEGIQVDWETQREKIIRKKFESLLKALGVEWQEVFGKKQTKLEEFIA